MIIKSMSLQHYRNYKTLCLDFDPATNIFYGDNAQGKTNILEAVYVSGTTKSHRSSKDRDLISFFEEEAHIRTLIEKNGIEHKIDMHLRKNRTKGIAIDGIPIRKASELFGIIHFVFFSPEDLSIIKNGPSERRRFLDMELCQLDKIYLHHLSNYNRVVLQRNRILKEMAFRPDYQDVLDVLDVQMIKYGTQVIVRRRHFIEELSQIMERIHNQLAGGQEQMALEYEADTDETSFAEQLKRNMERDLMKKMIHDTPVLLLDDVLSELDSSRQNYLLNSIQNVQTMLTCTGLDELIEHRFSIHKVYRVADGNVSVEN